MSFLDKKIIRLFQAYIALDEAMAVNLRTKACKPVFVANPWATYVTPSKPLALKDWEKTLKLVYAGNYGAAHDLSPFLQYLKGQPVIIKSQLSISFVGMPAPIGTALRDRFLEVGVAAEFLPRFSSFSKLLQFLHRFHFGIVSLKDCQRGLACPSKAFTYVSQGIPLCYVGPNKTLTDSLLEKGWGISYTQLADVIESGDYLENIRQNQGFSYPSVREESLGIMMSVLKGMQRGEQVWEQ
ncbi:MAG: hypothetical protein HRU19_19450 [Pseudobacteriovorax sp.]|nr:hypothetical protein [Pseudobacteriovorax sp.]